MKDSEKANGSNRTALQEAAAVALVKMLDAECVDPSAAGKGFDVTAPLPQGIQDVIGAAFAGAVHGPGPNKGQPLAMTQQVKSGELSAFMALTGILDAWQVPVPIEAALAYAQHGTLGVSAVASNEIQRITGFESRS